MHIFEDFQLSLEICVFIGPRSSQILHGTLFLDQNTKSLKLEMIYNLTTNIWQIFKRILAFLVRAVFFLDLHFFGKYEIFCLGDEFVINYEHLSVGHIGLYIRQMCP
jgi:uncharacterized membrane protein YraQ (UPF0718 family)